MWVNFLHSFPCPFQSACTLSDLLIISVIFSISQCVLEFMSRGYLSGCNLMVSRCFVLVL